MRIGVHVGDVFYRGDDVFGDGVNVASRVMSQAEPRQIYVTRDVMSIAYGKLDLLYKDRRLFNLKNIDRPIHIYEVLWDPARAGEASKDIHLGTAAPPRRQSWVGIALAAVIVLAAGTMFLKPGTNDRSDGRIPLAVMEFEAETDDPRLQRVQIDKILTDAVVTKFSEFKPVQIISPKRVHDVQSEVLAAGISSIDFGAVEQVGSRVEGQLVIEGKLTQLDSQLILRAALWDLSREDEVLDKLVVSVSSAEELLSTVVDSMSFRFQKKLVDAYDLDIAEVHNLVSIGELTMHSVDA